MSSHTRNQAHKSQSREKSYIDNLGSHVVQRSLARLNLHLHTYQAKLLGINSPFSDTVSVSSFRSFKSKLH